MSVTFSPEGDFDVEDIEDIEVQMSNANARHMCIVLDLDFTTLEGRESSNDFLARVLIALAQDRSDDGTPTFKEGNIMFCGRAAGYETRKLLQLHGMALWAVERGAPNIIWC